MTPHKWTHDSLGFAWSWLDEGKVFLRKRKRGDVVISAPGGPGDPRGAANHTVVSSLFAKRWMRHVATVPLPENWPSLTTEELRDLVYPAMVTAELTDR
jgi:hypothetical protein